MRVGTAVACTDADLQESSWTAAREVITPQVVQRYPWCDLLYKTDQLMIFALPPSVCPLAPACPNLPTCLYQAKACKNFLRKGFSHSDGSYQLVREELVSSAVHVVVLL